MTARVPHTVRLRLADGSPRNVTVYAYGVDHAWVLAVERVEAAGYKLASGVARKRIAA